MRTYYHKTNRSSPVKSDGQNDFPILEKHWQNFTHAAADALGRRWLHPDDRDFTDRPPPDAPAAAKPKTATTLDIVGAFRAKRRVA